MAKIELNTPLTRQMAADLKAGDELLLSGTIYVARDAAHKRMLELIDSGQELPVDLRNQIIFYAGPTPPKPGQVIGSIAPTTASRMDPYAPAMFKYGVTGTIGKGPRGQEVKVACQTYQAVCLSAVGGLSALLAERVKSSEVVAYDDLGPEAIRKLQVEQFPVYVVYDAHGGDLYEQEIAKYRSR